MNSNSIKSKIRGPFAYMPGKNGVDNTFDVICLCTGYLVAYSSYWEDRDNAEAIAYAMTFALNRHYQPIRSRLKPAKQLLLDRFRHLYPGPYSALAFANGEEMTEIGVTDSRNEFLILAEDSGNADAECIAYHHWLAELLNDALGYPNPPKHGASHDLEVGDVAR